MRLCRRKYRIIKLKVYDQKDSFISHHKTETIRPSTESNDAIIRVIRSHFYNYGGSFQIIVTVSFKL